MFLVYYGSSYFCYGVLTVSRMALLIIFSRGQRVHTVCNNNNHDNHVMSPNLTEINERHDCEAETTAATTVRLKTHKRLNCDAQSSSTPQ